MKLRNFFIIPILILLTGCASLTSPVQSSTLTVEQTQTSAPTPTLAPTPDYASWLGVYFGVFQGGQDVEQQLGQKFAIQLYYHQWDSPFNAGAFSSNLKNGWITESTWEYKATLTGVDDPYALQPLKAIIDGKKDDYIREFAHDAGAFGQPLFLRWGHEMNGDWYIWSGTKNGGATLDKYGDPLKPDGPELFVDAYRHIHDIFNEEKATNVLWVWCPNILMEGKLGEAWNEIGNYYPGDEYVDWLCMDGYNWGASQSWSSWQTFDQVFAPTYTRLQQISPTKPIIIGEFASSDKGGDKAAWVTDAFQKISSVYPQIRAIVWFNIDKETDWRMNSSPAVFDVFKKELAQPGWMESWPGFEK